MEMLAANNQTEAKSKPNLFIKWMVEQNSCLVDISDASSGLAVMLTPIEVEALILHLCQSPWRLVSPPSDGVAIH